MALWAMEVELQAAQQRFDDLSKEHEVALEQLRAAKTEANTLTAKLKEMEALLEAERDQKVSETEWLRAELLCARDVLANERAMYQQQLEDANSVISVLKENLIRVNTLVNGAKEDPDALQKYLGTLYEQNMGGDAILADQMPMCRVSSGEGGEDPTKPVSLEGLVEGDVDGLKALLESKDQSNFQPVPSAPSHNYINHDDGPQGTKGSSDLMSIVHKLTPGALVLATTFAALLSS